MRLSWTRVRSGLMTLRIADLAPADLANLQRALNLAPTCRLARMMKNEWPVSRISSWFDWSGSWAIFNWICPSYHRCKKAIAIQILKRGLIEGHETPNSWLWPWQVPRAPKLAQCSASFGNYILHKCKPISRILAFPIPPPHRDFIAHQWWETS